jgi:PTH1 family peptidyl-tRNA hydrolase
MPFFRRSLGPPQWLIAGLGNPGRQYALNRHNAGFLCLDVLAEGCHAKIDKLKFHALLGQAELAGQRCLLLKPNTFMNSSGEALAEAARFYQIPPERVLVIFDDVSLPPGKLRIRRDGSAGGHNGIKSIIAHLGTNAFPRIKLGVGAKPNPEYDLADWVLSNLPQADLQELRKACDAASEAIPLILQGQIEEAMGRFN